jgi:hypothetical protein
MLSLSQITNCDLSVRVYGIAIFDLVYCTPIDRALNFVASATWYRSILAELIENFQRQNRQCQLGR